MMHTILAGLVFAAIVLTPWLIASLRRTAEPEYGSETDIFEEGFI